MDRCSFSNRKSKTILACSIIIGILSLSLYIGQTYLSGSRVKQQYRRFAPSESDYYIYDTIAGFIHKPNTEKKMKWAEHQGGEIAMITNNMGFREDDDTQAQKKEEMIRVLVTGDSHIDGVVYNAESFPNRLEQLLNADNGKVDFEIINGGTGHYGPQDYAGFLKKFLYLTPDVFIVVIYTGNDFLDAITIALSRNELILPGLQTDTFHGGQDEYLAKLKTASRTAEGAVSQALNQIYYFKNFPEMKKNALEITQKQLQNIQELCASEGIRFLVLLLPTKSDVEWQFDRTRLELATNQLQLSEQDLALNRQLTRLLAQWLDQHGIRCFDLIDVMKNHQEELFYKQDYHINVAGHRLIAEVMYRTYFSKFEP